MAGYGRSSDDQDSNDEMRVHPSDKQKTPYTFAGFMEFCNGVESKAQRMWTESRPAQDGEEPASKRHRSENAGQSSGRDDGAHPKGEGKGKSKGKGEDDDEAGVSNFTVTVLNIPVDYTHETMVELHAAAGLDTSTLESSRFGDATLGEQDPGFCQVWLRYKDENSAWEASQRLHGQEVAGEADEVRKMQAHFQKTRSPTNLNPSVYLSDVPVEYTEPMLRDLHEELGLGGDSLVGAKFLPSRDPTGQTGACICRYADQSSAEKAIELLRGRAVVTTSGDKKFLGARMAKPAKWMVDQGLAADQKAAYENGKKASREHCKKKPPVNPATRFADNFVDVPMQSNPNQQPNQQRWQEVLQQRQALLHNQAHEQRQQHESRQNNMMEMQKQASRWQLLEGLSTRWKLSGSTNDWLKDLPLEVLKPLISQYNPKHKEDEGGIPENVLSLLDEPGLFLTGLPPDADEEFVDALLSMYGVMKKCTLTAAGPSGALAAVVMEEIEDAKIAAAELNNLTPDGMEAPLGARLVDPAAEKSKTEERAKGHDKALAKLAKSIELTLPKTPACPPQMPPAIMPVHGSAPLPPPEPVDLNGFARHWQLDQSTVLYLSRLPVSVQAAVVNEFVPSAVPKQQGGEPCTNLFVSGLPDDVTEELLQDNFGMYGTVVKCKLISRQRDDKKAALVLMETVDEASNVIEHLDQQILEGLEEPVSIRFADNRAEGAKAVTQVTKEVKAFADNRVRAFKESVANRMPPPAPPQHQQHQQHQQQQQQHQQQHRRIPSLLPGQAPPPPPPGPPALHHNPAFAAVQELALSGASPDKIGQLLATPQGASLQPLLTAIGAKALLDSLGHGGKGGLSEQVAAQMQIPPAPQGMDHLLLAPLPPGPRPRPQAGWAQFSAQGPPPRAARRAGRPTSLRPAAAAEDEDSDAPAPDSDLGYGPIANASAPTSRVRAPKVPKQPAHPPTSAVRAFTSKPSQALSSTSQEPRRRLTRQQAAAARQGSSFDEADEEEADEGEADEGEASDQEPTDDAQPGAKHHPGWPPARGPPAHIIQGGPQAGQKSSRLAASSAPSSARAILKPTSKGKPPSKPTPKAAAGLGASAKAKAPAPSPWRQDQISRSKTPTSKVLKPSAALKRQVAYTEVPAKRRSAGQDDGSCEDEQDWEEEVQTPDNEEPVEDDEW